jgi:hypothetical protein
MTPSEQDYVRHQARLLLQVAAEREAAERAAKCVTEADLEGFAAAALAKLQRGASR